MRRVFTKKSLAAIVSSAMLITALASCGGSTKPSKEDGSNSQAATESMTEKASESADAPKEDTANKNQVIIGTSSDPTGDYAYPYWLNGAVESYLDGLIRAYSTVEVDLDGRLVMNDKVVVDHVESKENEDGTKTYTFKIKDGLTYDDGTKITAKDYIAESLFFSSKELKEAEATTVYSPGSNLVGFDQYNSGDSKTFKGIHLLDDMTFSVDIAKENLPNYFELSLVGFRPFPLAFWTKDGKGGPVEVKDDGEGAYLSENFNFEDYKDVIKEARLNPVRPSCGPYKSVEFDKVNKVYTLKKNDSFLGDAFGHKPEIETIIVKKTTTATQVDELKTGKVDVISDVLSGAEINAGLDLVEESGEKFKANVYPRSGYGRLAFVCDAGPTQFANVRKAVAHLINRPEFIKSFAGGYASIVNGPYGEGQWMYKDTKAELADQLESYAYSYEKAVQLLEEDGWVLDEQGNPYKEGIRYKKVDGELMPLILKWGASENNPVSELLNTMLSKSDDVKKAGMKVEQEVMQFGELLNYLSRNATAGDKYGVPKFNMFTLGTGFPAAYTAKDQYKFEGDKVAQPNRNFIMDQELSDISNSYFLHSPEDKEGFLKDWVKFVVRWNQVLPDLPLYSNQVHDFYNGKIEGYENTAYSNAFEAVARARVK